MTTRNVGGAILLLAIIASQAVGDQEIPLKAMLGDDVFRHCGLDRLDRDQLELLGAHFAPPPSADFVARSAVSYLERDGWRTIQLQGAYRENPESAISDIRHLARVAPETLVLEAIGTTSIPLEPGAYLAKVAGFSVEVIDQHGEVRRFTIEERF